MCVGEWVVEQTKHLFGSGVLAVTEMQMCNFIGFDRKKMTRVKRGCFRSPLSAVLPQEFEAWVNDTSGHGFVVVAFGAGVKYLSHDIAHKLAGALARLPQRVVWR